MRNPEEQTREALREKNYNEVIKLATEAIASQPEQSWGWTLRATAYVRTGQSERAIADLDHLLKINPKQPSLLEVRGSEQFKLGRFERAIADFDKECELDPAREPWHWKRGLAYYYAGEYEKGRDQFQRYHNLDDNDVENAVWRVLCMARIKDVGLEKAQQEILVVRRDSRVPMMEVYSLFAGKATRDDVLQAIERGKPDKDERNMRTFYGHLYLGLYYDMTGETNRANEHLKTAVIHPIDHFMGDIAKLHLALLEKAAGKQTSPSATKPTTADKNAKDR